MASLTIRNLDNNLKEQIRLSAAQNSRSMEAEVRAILAKSLNFTKNSKNLATTIHNRFALLDVTNLPIPSRQTIRNPPDFGE